ncbi:MAG: hypothetical protein P4L22_03255 [Candidatus Babeliales bacterium]|nr:hypothetical protein [Candidatus Babeliales bacterium]
MDTQTELNYREKLYYINTKQFNANIEHLLKQGENNKLIAECLIYLTNQMADLTFYLNGTNSKLKSVTIDTTKNTKAIEAIDESLNKSE